jgi:hypothetical protein
VGLSSHQSAAAPCPTILAGVATWEREIMLERQREGIAKAKAAGKYKGRPVSIDAAHGPRLPKQSKLWRGLHFMPMMQWSCRRTM